MRFHAGWLMGDLADTTLTDPKALEARIERALNRPAWRENVSRGIAHRDRSLLTHDAQADRVHGLERGSTALAWASDRLVADVVVPNDVAVDDGPLPRPAVAVCHSDDIGWRARIERLAAPNIKWGTLWCVLKNDAYGCGVRKAS